MAMQSGMTLGWSSPMLYYLGKSSSFLGGLNGTDESWVSSLMPLGAILGAVPSGMLADYIGRKPAIMITAIPFLISWIMLIFLRSFESILTARFIGGIGSGAACVLVPTYIGEVAEPSIRGALGSFFPLLFSTGIVFIYIVGALVDYTLANVLCCAMLIPFTLMIPFLPESPYWLVQKHCTQSAEKSLKILRGKQHDIKRELTTLREEAYRVGKRRGGFRDLIGTRAGRKAILTCIGLMWFQQMCGIDALLFYTVSIFNDAGSTIEAHLATIIIGIIEVVMAIVVAIVIDKFGRKPLLVLSGSSMSICLGVLGYYFMLKDSDYDVTSIGWVPLTCLSLFNVTFSVGYGSVPFAVISELFPPETKGVAISTSIIVNWSLVFLVTKLYPIMIASPIKSHGTFWLFSSMTALSAIFGYFLVPETKGKTLQEIQTKLKYGKVRIDKVLTTIQAA